MVYTVLVHKMCNEIINPIVILLCYEIINPIFILLYLELIFLTNDLISRESDN